MNRKLYLSTFLYFADYATRSLELNMQSNGDVTTVFVPSLDMNDVQSENIENNARLMLTNDEESVCHIISPTKNGN